MSNQGPLFPKKSDTPGDTEESPPLVIERSDDPNFGKPTGRSRPSLPTRPGKPVGCSTGVFLVLLTIASLAIGVSVF